MPPATDAQVQQFVNERIRVRSEQIRALLLALKDDKASIDDVYDACEPPANATWDDVRVDGPPHLLTPEDVLAYNSFITALIPQIEEAADFPIIQKACVRPVGS